MPLKKLFTAILSIFILAVACVVAFGALEDRLAVRGQERWTDAERAYQWLVAGQRMNRKFFVLRTGLIPSYENGEDCFVYDEALAAMAFTYRGDYGRARRIFKFFDGVRKRHIREKGGIWGFTDVYKRHGAETETRAAGPNAWILMALNYYFNKTDDREFFPLARDIADWLISLQSIEGGIIGGYYGNGEPMAWISTEHNFDCYAALRDFGIISGEDKYIRKAKEVYKWLHDDVWDEGARRFLLGRRNPNFATDLSSWAVLSLGTKYAESLDFALEKSLNTQFYEVGNTEVEGFDFGSTYKTSPFPDKDAVWFEGTSHMVLAFDIAGREAESDYFLSELDKCLTDSPVFPYTKGLPYASNEGTPVYDSWLMQDKPLCVAGTAWYFFAKNGFNPFSAFGDIEAPNKTVEEIDHLMDYQFAPVVDDFEYTDIKFHTAYPEDLLLVNKADVALSRTEELSADNGHSMKIEFTPYGNAKTASAAIKRSFLYPQNWSTYNTITIWVYSRGTSGRTNNIANFSVKDREGEIYNSPPIFLNRNGWRRYTFDLWRDFSRDPYDGVTYGDGLFGLSRIIEISFFIRSKHPVESCRVYLDKIELARSTVIDK